MSRTVWEFYSAWTAVTLQKPNDVIT